jgi:hypothetical protein
MASPCKREGDDLSSSLFALRQAALRAAADDGSQNRHRTSAWEFLEALTESDDCEPVSVSRAWGAHTTEWRSQMTKMETLSAVIILSAAIATPVFAQDAGLLRLDSRSGSKPQPVTSRQSNFRAGYNQLNGTSRTQDGSSKANLGFDGSDPTRVGGEDPTSRPAG